MKLALALLVFVLVSCSDNKEVSSSKPDTSNLNFTELSKEESGVEFVNQLDINKMYSFMVYINVFNGGGVAIGDVNNDGLEDLYFTGNLTGNKLFINKGNFEFEDITESAGVALEGLWSNGVTMTDINQDGWLDIYVCLAYSHDANKRANRLFVNQKDGTFKESAKEYGIADNNYSIQANFFDFDKDGDTDLFVGNHPLGITMGNKDHTKAWANPEIEFSDRLYRNEGNGKFTDITEESGILNYGWTLSALTADFNDDGWMDIYVAVDHEHPDRLYVNQGDGTFKDEIAEHFRHTSASSMGMDICDINNDGYQDLYTVDMLAKDNYREKTQMGSMNPKIFWDRINMGYHYQYMRNMLHLNRGEGEYSEIGQMAGISRTNWSWASLFFDFDSDGYEDLFVTNGYYKDVMYKDDTKYRSKVLANASKKGDREIRRVLDSINQGLRETPIPNDFYKNVDGFNFEDFAEKAGVDKTGFSSGAAYADLDNDGDMDLVVCNIDQNISIYKNNTVDKGKSSNNFVSIILKDYPSGDPQGSLVKIEYQGNTKSKYFIRTRGYASSVGQNIHFGLGSNDQVDKLTIVWPNGKEQVVARPAINQVVEVAYDNNSVASQKNKKAKLIEPAELLDKSFKHQEDNFDDYLAQVLLPHQMSKFGPFISKGDVNGDGLEDIYIGGAAGQSAVLYLQQSDGKFNKNDQIAFQLDKKYEDMGSVFLDADQDGDLDLYVVSGGNHRARYDKVYRDRYYSNDNGTFKKVKSAIPNIEESGGRVTSGDIDGDGDIDLVVCGRQVPHQYPKPETSRILINVNGKFEDATDRMAPELKDIGLACDAEIVDINSDGKMDLVLVGEWMPIEVFINDGNTLKSTTEDYGLSNTVGWWNRVEAADFDKDGKMDLVVGNLGDNYKYRASEGRPFHVYAKDFDDNQTYDIALGYYLEGETLFPVRGRQCSSEQVPEIADKFPTYDAFAKASITEVYGESLEGAIHYEAKLFSSVVLHNTDNGLLLKALPPLAQISPVNGIDIADYNQDGHDDILIAGNLYTSEVETGRADAGLGLLLEGNGKMDFTARPAYESGVYFKGDVKDVMSIDLSTGNKAILVTRNDDEVMSFIGKKTIQ